MSSSENEKIINKAAADVMALARNTLIVNLRFLDIAISRLQLAPLPEGTLSTDGMQLKYEPRHVLRCFRDEHDRPARDYLHTVFHCIFSHMFVGTLVDRRLWDLACDIAVEASINDLGLSVTGADRQAAQKSEIERVRTAAGMLTAEKIYRYFLDSSLPDREIRRLRKLFEADDHSGWYTQNVSGNQGKRERDGSDPGKLAEPRELPEIDEELYRDDFIGKWEHFGNIPDIRAEYEQTDGDWSVDGGASDLEEEWRKIAEKIKEDMETFSKEHGDAAGGMMQNLREVTREKYDYTDFLRKFAVLGEAMTINDDEFDYIYYTYGLKLYGNLPLVEPLEYKEVRKIREFVIAIDTSGSTSGELVHRFLQKTYNILKSTESYFSKVNIHIMQCDSAVQEHVKITSEEEFDEYIENMTILGLGGTDFRPVFSYTDELIEKGEFTDLRGLIYFTDGDGVFPDRKPGYDTVFVFIDNEYKDPHVPPWAIRLVLQDDEI